MAGLLSDFGFALRRIRRAPRFSLAVVLVLGLGLGTCALSVGLVNVFFWQAVNVPAPDELVTLHARTTEGAPRPIPHRLAELLAQPGTTPVEHWCTYGPLVAPTKAGGQSDFSLILRMGGQCSATFQTPPLMGRMLDESDAPFAGAAENVAMIGYGYWQRMFGGAADVLGQTVQIEQAVFTIVGVLPPGFRGLQIENDVALVVPYQAYMPSIGASTLVGRLAPGATMAQADAGIRASWPALAAETAPAMPMPGGGDGTLDFLLEPGRAGLSPFRQLYGSQVTQVSGLTVLLVLAAAFNIGGLLCARVAGNPASLAILAQLGASRGRILRTMVCEVVVLALIGCALGLGVAVAMEPAAIALFPAGNIPVAFSSGIDVRLTAIMTAATLVIAVLATLLPAWLALGRGHSLAATRTVARSTNRWAQAALVAQVAVTLVLAFSSMLLVRSLVSLQQTDRGYTSGDVLSVRLVPTAGGYEDLDQTTYYPDLVRRTAAISGVSGVAMARYTGTVRNEGPWYGPVMWPGQDQPVTTAVFEYVTPQFFDIVGIPLLRGRDVAWSDTPGAPDVVMVSESLARTLSEDGNVVGRSIRYGNNNLGTDPEKTLEIVGVVGDVSFGNSRVRDLRTLYFPAIQAGQATLGTLHIRTAPGERARVTDEVRGVLQSLGREQVIRASTFDGLFDNWLVSERMGAAVGTAVTTQALIIASVGVYALLAFAVARRTREMGIRMAIGATNAQVAGLFVREAATLCGLGILVGVPLALASARTLDALMFGVSASDVTTLGVAAGLMLLTALAAAVAPSRRAARVDPAVTLRAE